MATALTALFALAAFAFWLGRSRAVAALAGGAQRLPTRPVYYGHYVAMWSASAALLALVCGRAIVPRSDAASAASVLLAGALALGVAVALAARRRVGPALNAREPVERAVELALAACSALAILATIGIVVSLLFEAMRFFTRVAPLDFLLGLEWSPQTAIRADQVGSSGAFGAVPVFAGTLLITAIAMAVSVPVGLFSAVYLSEYASARVRAVVKPLLEVLAGIPTVVYGVFAALSVGPALRALGERVGLAISSESALAAGAVMGVMIIPFVSSLSDDVIKAVPSRCARARSGSAPRPPRRSAGWCSPPRSRASSAPCCSRSRARSARP